MNSQQKRLSFNRLRNIAARINRAAHFVGSLLYNYFERIPPQLRIGICDILFNDRDQLQEGVWLKMNKPTLKTQLFKILITLPPRQRQVLIKQIEEVIRAASCEENQFLPASSPWRRRGLTGDL